MERFMKMLSTLNQQSPVTLHTIFFITQSIYLTDSNQKGIEPSVNCFQIIKNDNPLFIINQPPYIPNYLVCHLHANFSPPSNPLLARIDRPPSRVEQKRKESQSENQTFFRSA